MTNEASKREVMKTAGGIRLLCMKDGGKIRITNLLKKSRERETDEREKRSAETEEWYNLAQTSPGNRSDLCRR